MISNEVTSMQKFSHFCGSISNFFSNMLMCEDNLIRKKEKMNIYINLKIFLFSKMYIVFMEIFLN